jgi:hypothetical protein
MSGFHCCVAKDYRFLGINIRGSALGYLRMEAANFTRHECYITNKNGVKFLKNLAFSDCHIQRKDSGGRVYLPVTCE